jgi:indole-3-glycerol phosphate synthase
VLGDGDVSELLDLAHKLGMNALVEVHTEEELGRMLALPNRPRIIGINNRNLQTFEVDFENTGRLRQLIPAEVVVVGESGLKTTADVQKMGEMGVDAILVGETFVKSKNAFQKAQEFVRAGK